MRFRVHPPTVVGYPICAHSRRFPSTLEEGNKPKQVLKGDFDIKNQNLKLIIHLLDMLHTLTLLKLCK